MKLDSRIIDGKKPLTCFDSDEAKQFIGQEGYFSNDKTDFQDLNDACRDVLQDVLDSYDDNTPPFKYSDYFLQNYFLPIAWTKEKPYRAYQVKEFYDLFADKVGKQVFTIRNKYDPDNAFVALLTEVPFYTNTNKYLVGLGTDTYTLPELVKKYEIFDNSENKWKPFGVEVKE